MLNGIGGSDVHGRVCKPLGILPAAPVHPFGAFLISLWYQRATFVIIFCLSCAKLIQGRLLNILQVPRDQPIVGIQPRFQNYPIVLDGMRALQ